MRDVFNGWFCFRWLAVLLCAGTALTTRAELIFDVFVGYGLGATDGVIAEGAWFPVTCEIQNDGPAFNATVEVAGGQFGNGQPRLVRVELPTGTRKRFIVPVFASARYRLAVDARLRNDKGKVLAQHIGLEPVRYVDWQHPLIASVSQTHGGAAALPEVGNRSQPGPATTRISTDFFPENPLALEGVDTLYLHSTRALELKQPQATALMAWLHGGGHLVLAIEQPSDLTALPWLSGVLPCAVSGISTLDRHEAFQQWLNSTEPTPDDALPRGAGRTRSNLNPFKQLATDATFEGAPMPVALAKVRDGQVLVGTPENPLVLSAVRGRGQLTALLFSPELEPFRSWQNRNWFWAKLSGVPLTWLSSAPVQNPGTAPLDGVFGAMVDSKQIRKLPVGWLLLLLVAYLVVIGPLDHYFLKKINRQMLTWITFPTYVVLFSGLIYFIGYSLRSGETEWNELHVVDIVPHGDRADLRGRTFGSAYSPVNTRYAAASGQPFATMRGEIGPGAANEISKVTVVQRDHSFDAELSVPVWTSQLYVSDWWRQGAAPLAFTVTSRGNQWELQVQNTSGKTIAAGKLFIEGRIYDVGNIAAQRPIFLNKNSGESLPEFLQRNMASMAQVAAARQQQFGRQHAGRITDILNTTAAASFLAALPAESPETSQRFQYYGRFALPRRFDLSPLLRRGDAVFIAFLPDASIVPPLNKFSPRYSKKDTVLRVASAIQGAPPR